MLRKIYICYWYDSWFIHTFILVSSYVYFMSVAVHLHLLILTVQTVEAMKTILDSLSNDDYFSIIDFNHNVRCWSEELVSGNSIKVAEAKQYIQDIKPNGGEIASV